MIFSWLKRRRRQRLLAEPFPEAWHDYLRSNFVHYGWLSEPEQAKLRDLLRVFIAEKQWEGCKGLEMTDEIRVTVAAQACLLLLHLEHDYFSHVPTILVYPRGYRRPRKEAIGGGDWGTVILEGEVAVDGEAGYRGPVILSWENVLEEGRDPEGRRNLVLHEFAHQLDMEDGEVNGTPWIRDARLAERWAEVMGREYERLQKALDRGRDTVLDEDAGDDPGEFFAVATECFFSDPHPLRQHQGDLYALFRDYYRQDPADRSPMQQ
jgi:Mlc titration factor MtfA (ptsG expression regulator)